MWAPFVEPLNQKVRIELSHTLALVSKQMPHWGFRIWFVTFKSESSLMIFRDLKTNEWEFSCDVFKIAATRTANWLA